MLSSQLGHFIFNLFFSILRPAGNVSFHARDEKVYLLFLLFDNNLMILVFHFSPSARTVVIFLNPSKVIEQWDSGFVGPIIIVVPMFCGGRWKKKNAGAIFDNPQQSRVVVNDQADPNEWGNETRLLSFLPSYHPPSCECWTCDRLNHFGVMCSSFSSLDPTTRCTSIWY